MSDYTPTTEQVRELFLQDCLPSEYDEYAGQFDRWLRQVKAQAWDEGVGYVSDYPEDLRSGNPYR